MAEPK